jgi:HK97 family phage major capsid protein
MGGSGVVPVFPVVDSNAAASWLAEGDDITETDPGLGECVVTPNKVTALTQISNELIADSADNTQASGVVGDGLVRQFARTIDSTFFTSTTTLATAQRAFASWRATRTPNRTC